MNLLLITTFLTVSEIHSSDLILLILLILIGIVAQLDRKGFF